MSMHAELAPSVSMPDPETVCELVNSVTSTMLGMQFALAPVMETSQAAQRTAMLPIYGATPMTIAVSSDIDGCAALGSALFKCPTGAVDSAIMDDTLCELVNMIGALVRSAMQIDQTFGLPELLAHGSPLPVFATFNQICLACGPVPLVVSIAGGIRS
jgi:hypothetical protein